MKKNKFIIYAFSGLLVVSFLFAFFSFLYSSFENVSARSLDERISYREKEILAEKKKRASIGRWGNIEKEYKKFKTDYLMKMDEFSTFRNELNGLFLKNRLTSKGVNHRYKRIFRDVDKVEINFSVTGTYPNIKQFIHDINSKKKMIIIKSIQFKKNKNAGNGLVKFLMEVYLAR